MVVVVVADVVVKLGVEDESCLDYKCKGRSHHLYAPWLHRGW
jgi:hypothetical protein